MEIKEIMSLLLHEGVRLNEKSVWTWAEKLRGLREIFNFFFFSSGCHCRWSFPLICGKFGLHFQSFLNSCEHSALYLLKALIFKRWVYTAENFVLKLFQVKHILPTYDYKLLPQSKLHGFLLNNIIVKPLKLLLNLLNLLVVWESFLYKKMWWWCVRHIAVVPVHGIGLTGFCSISKCHWGFYGALKNIQL